MAYTRLNILEDIIAYVNKPLVKVLTGLRRSGKSSILQLLQEHLLDQGVDAERLVHISFESLRNQHLLTAGGLYTFLSERITSDDQYYLFLDEIQEVKDWEKAINSCLVDFRVDIYITGSNSNLLSSELSTYLAGRYVSFLIQPLSFRESIDFYNHTHEDTQDLNFHFERYLRLGGFPVLHIADYEYEDAYRIVYDIYTSTILRDTIQRYSIRDIELLERVVKFSFENMGHTFSANRVAQYFKSQYRKVDINTVHNYLEALTSAFLLQKVERYDVRGKEILKTQEKYFPGDHAFLYALFGYRTEAISGILESIVYHELIRRGYRVYIGKLDRTEIDFVAKKRNKVIYIQVAYKMELPETIKREYQPLLKIKDQYPKLLLSMDEDRQDNYQGVRHLHIRDFLLDEKW